MFTLSSGILATVPHSLRDCSQHDWLFIIKPYAPQPLIKIPQNSVSYVLSQPLPIHAAKDPADPLAQTSSYHIRPSPSLVKLYQDLTQVFGLEARRRVGDDPEVGLCCMFEERLCTIFKQKGSTSP